MAITKCINNWTDSANSQGIFFNKDCSSLTEKYF